LLGAALAALFLPACGSTSEADPYQGTVFATDGTNIAFDTKFLPSTDNGVCPSGNCYPLQLGYANAAGPFTTTAAVGATPVLFYNLISLLYTGTTPVPPQVGPVRSATSSTLIPVTVADRQTLGTTAGAGGSHVDLFAAGSCTKGSYDPQLDPFKRDAQAPLFDSLPLATQSTANFVWPIVATYSIQVGSPDKMTCNDLKDNRSIPDLSTGAQGPFGAQRLGVAPKDYRLWAPIDWTAPVMTATVRTKIGSTFLEPVSLSPASDPDFAPHVAWYRGMQLQYVDGGLIPTDTAGKNLKTMDGVLLSFPSVFSSDPPATNIGKVMANGAVLLQYPPGDANYSPIVQLQTFALPNGKNAGDIVGFCPLTQVSPCPANYYKVTGQSFTTYRIFIVAQGAKKN
jgi:hypothetical protein